MMARRDTMASCGEGGVAVGGGPVGAGLGLYSSWGAGGGGVTSSGG